MTEFNEIPAESKIIIGVEYSDSTTWYSLHLHDALFAISIRSDQQRVVIAEGRGRGRLRHLRIPFKNIFRFETVEIPIGHNCITAPVDGEHLGDRQLLPINKPFSPVMVRLLVKHSTRSDFISIHDIGATPLPIIVPLLRNLPEEQTRNADISLTSANDCFTLSRKVIEWVQQVNTSIEQVRSRVIVTRTTADGQIPYYSDDADFQRLRMIYASLNDSVYDAKDVILTGSGGYSAVLFTKYLRTDVKKTDVQGTANVISCCPIARPMNVANDNAAKYVSFEDFVEVATNYHLKTKRPVKEGIDCIIEHLNDLDDRLIGHSSRDLQLLEETPKPIVLFDPGRSTNAARRVLRGVTLRHRDDLLKVFENEGVEVYELDKLPFLSLLVQYQTGDGKDQYAVIIKSGLHPALREFLYGHEMGHWFLHVKPRIGDLDKKVERFLSSSAHKSFLEREADNFAMMVLFPPAYLADYEIFSDGISATALLREFTDGMPSVSSRLKREMLRYLDQHIETYQNFRQTGDSKVLTIEVKSIEEKNLPGLLALMEDTVHWVQIDSVSKIIDASNNSQEVFGLTRREIIGLTPADLVVEEERIPMKHRADYRKEHKKAIYYFTEVLNLKTNQSRQVVVYSFPILNKGKYVGAIAALKRVQ